MCPQRQDSIRERVNYDAPDLPLYIHRSILSDYAPSLSAVCHWHDDVEFMYMCRGHMDYNVDGTIYHMDEGDGIFVNSNRLHYGFSPDGSDSEFICILLTPTLLSATAYIEQNYIRPVTGSQRLRAVVLERECADDAALLTLLQRIWSVYQSGAPDYVLQLQSLFYRVWQELFRRVPGEQTGAADQGDRLSLKMMLGFIHDHHGERITAADIAAAGFVSQSKCFRLFRRYINRTPVECLTEYRLKVGCQLLAETDLSVTEIAARTGFVSSSYFAERFRQHYGCTPLQFRRRSGGPSAWQLVER
ncbi:MAG: AraC family transcriptional regulator [Oscillospiraceae bacterium]|nr:AraC family transcriptional regulator [Oscillospiraceae bacterium]